MHASADEIRSNVTDFRKALLAALRSGKMPQTMEDFPRGCCSDSALMLGTYLSDIGLGDFKLVVGERGCFDDNDWFSHAWLEQENLIVDITGSQFGEESNEITITINSVWHESFNLIWCDRANLKEMASELRPYYELVLSHLEK
ncbi:hypothetical protein [Marinobacter adhaerens]|uniref:hypothetical protein n=1 Tax=Marinobacter adhaerens TaxID=1033846 RepID=UPI001E2FC116|nr:hypothetical protein [Marinobacter adhaerens]MCD1645727.1 hypothetical protein [Marinobacter adhaerens]